MFKTETHLHVSEVSFCSHLTAAEMIRLYAKAGYHTVFVSDHFSENYFRHLGNIPWEQKVHSFFIGYRNALAEGEKLGITVLPAAEIGFANNEHHYLVYGMTEEFLCKHPNILEYSVEKFHDIAKENGILLILAHPYRDNPNRIPTPHAVDGIEIYNSNPGHDDHSDLARQLAEEYNLLFTAGSDSHLIQDVGGTGILSEQPIRTVSEFISLIRSGKQQIIR